MKIKNAHRGIRELILLLTGLLLTHCTSATSYHHITFQKHVTLEMDGMLPRDLPDLIEVGTVYFSEENILILRPKVDGLQIEAEFHPPKKEDSVRFQQFIAYHQDREPAQIKEMVSGGTAIVHRVAFSIPDSAVQAEADAVKDAHPQQRIVGKMAYRFEFAWNGYRIKGESHIVRFSSRESDPLGN